MPHDFTDCFGLEVFRHGRETLHVAKHHRQVFAFPLHVVRARAAEHLSDKRCRQVGPKCLGERPAGQALQVVEQQRAGEHGRPEQQYGAQGHHEAERRVSDPPVGGEPGREGHDAHHRGRHGFEPARQERHQPGDGHELQHLEPQRCIGLRPDVTRQQAGEQVGVHLHARVGVADRRGALVVQAGRRGADDDELAGEAAGVEAVVQQIAGRVVLERSAGRAARAAKRHAHVEEFFDGNLLPVLALGQHHAAQLAPRVEPPGPGRGLELQRRVAHVGAVHRERKGREVPIAHLRQQRHRAHGAIGFGHVVEVARRVGGALEEFEVGRVVAERPELNVSSAPGGRIEHRCRKRARAVKGTPRRPRLLCQHETEHHVAALERTRERLVGIERRTQLRGRVGE